MCEGAILSSAAGTSFSSPGSNSTVLSAPVLPGQKTTATPLFRPHSVTASCTFPVMSSMPPSALVFSLMYFVLTVIFSAYDSGFCVVYPGLDEPSREACPRVSYGAVLAFAQRYHRRAFPGEAGGDCP